MSKATAVLYDHPGPRARLRNNVLSAVFLVLLALGVWWVIATLEDKGQLRAALWKPFLTSQMWTTYLLPGLWNTLKAALFSVVIALPIGALLGIARLSDHAWIRVPAGVVVEFFRAIPVLILMVFAFGFTVTVLDVADPLYAVVIALVLYNGSVLAEVFRAGILSLPRGQSEASLAIGMTKSQMMQIVLLPQALTAMLPAIVSQLVVVLKDTALGGILIGFVELRRVAGTAASFYKNVVPIYIVIAVIYILLNLALTSLASYLENRARRKRAGRGSGPVEPAPTVEAAQAPGLTDTGRL
ncbi:amino acid ABC transporter permease [Nakamurella deserti]|uniref:amino acid ABC transporter permease n=1 Tax=Nakamurella deserti TaxID=2164074 RepID=UPI000DBE7EEA|nr:amino acid ABC transporter permease [Nakamurella deserti]